MKIPTCQKSESLSLYCSWVALQSHTYRCIDEPVVQVAMHGIVLVVEVVELAVGIDEVAIPVVGEGQASGEVEGKAVVA